MSDINRILALSGLAQNGINTNVRAASNKKGSEMVEAVGDSAEAFYQLQDEFCGGECPSKAHKALIDELIRSMTGDEVKRFVDDFRRHYDMNDMEENVEEAESPMVMMTIPNVTPDMASKMERVAKEKGLEYSIQGNTVVVKGRRIDVTMFRTKMGIAQTNLEVVPVEEADSELSVMANSRDRVESTYAAIIKGDAEQTEVGDYIGRGMTKDQIIKLIDMLEPQGYDKDFLLKDLAPMMEADYDLSTLDGKYGNEPVKGKEGILQTNVEDDVNNIAATMEEDPELENFAMAFEKSVYASGDTSPEGIRAALEEVLPDYIAGSRIEDLMKVIEGVNEGKYKRRRLSKEEKQEFRLREKNLHETSRIRSLKDELVKELGD